MILCGVCLLGFSTTVSFDIITRSIGFERDVKVDVGAVPLKRGDQFIMCSDGLTGHVEFVSGVPQERIVELYAEAEVAVVPSLYEGFSLPAIEAMACGVPLSGFSFWRNPLYFYLYCHCCRWYRRYSF